MSRVLLSMVFLSLPLALSQEALSRSPDRVPNSPIPPLKEQIGRYSNRSAIASNTDSTKLVRKKSWTLIADPEPPSMAKSRNQPRFPFRTAARALPEESQSVPDEVDYEARRLELWNSLEMQMAREAVMEFCSLSAQTNPEEGQKFLEKLSQLSESEMLDWLERFHQRKENSSRGRDVAVMARQMKRDYAELQLETKRQSAARIAALRGSAIINTGALYPLSSEIRAAHYEFERAALESITRRYDPFNPVIDPSSPRGYLAQVAAAMSLEGDLPRDDPRNFIIDLENPTGGTGAVGFQPANAMEAPNFGGGGGGGGSP